MAHNPLYTLIDEALSGTLSSELKTAIDTALAAGSGKKAILTRLRQKHARTSPVVLAAEAYLGADQQGRITS